MLMTRMFSLIPGTPGRRQQMPRTMQIDRHARLRRPVQRLDDGRVHQRVHLGDDPPARSQRRFPLDERDDPILQPVRRDREPLPRRRRRIAGQQVEQGARVVGVRVARGEVRQIAVDARRRRVVVARRQVHVALDAVAFAAHDQRHLAVGLEPDEAVDDVHARVFQRARPLDVGRLVEARLQLDDRRHLLAVLGGADQRPHDRRVGAGPVQRLLDRQHVRIVGRLAR